MERDELIDDLEEILESWTGERDYREDPKRQIIKNNCANEIEQVIDRYRQS